jgi:hypothetical protein
VLTSWPSIAPDLIVVGAEPLIVAVHLNVNAPVGVIEKALERSDFRSSVPIFSSDLPSDLPSDPPDLQSRFPAGAEGTSDLACGPGGAGAGPARGFAGCAGASPRRQTPAAQTAGCRQLGCWDIISAHRVPPQRLRRARS